MEIIAKYTHGSGDSTDVDTYYVVDNVPSFQESKEWCDSIKEENANLISIKDGVVNACYKGVPDECNNSLLDTYSLHEQEYPLLVTKRVKRDRGVKYIRAVRIILSHLSRSQYRAGIKKALKSNSFSEKIDVLLGIDFNSIDFDTLSKNMSGLDILKTIAFQLGQAVGLKNGIELYTKADIAKEYPELKPYLYREKTSLDKLNEDLSNFLTYLYIHTNETADYVIIDNEVYDVLKECRISENKQKKVYLLHLWIKEHEYFSYDPLWRKLRGEEYEGQNYSDGLWFLYTDKTADEIRKDVRDLIYSDLDKLKDGQVSQHDILFICDMGSDYAGWFFKKGFEWLKEHKQ